MSNYLLTFSWFLFLNGQSAPQSIISTIFLGYLGPLQTAAREDRASVGPIKLDLGA